jgi:hypothetical protein
MADLKQYINLEPDGKDKRLGRTVQVKTKISVKKARTVHLWLKPEGGNLDPAKLNGGGQAGIGGPGDVRAPSITADDGSLSFQLVLSVQGGDKFSVEVSRDRAGKKKKPHGDKYEVWRKLYFQLSRMKATYSFSEGSLIGEYQKHFIELEKTSTELVPHKDNLETPELPTYQHHFKKVKSPFEAHVVLIDRQCDSKANRVRTGQNQYIEVYPLPRGSQPWPFADWVIHARWRPAGGAWQPGGVVTRVLHGGVHHLRVDLSALPTDPTKAAVEIDVSARTLVGEYTGDATYPPHVFIAIGKPRSEDSKCKTVAHEIGHGIGMVPRRGHALQYDNANGGIGSHCRHGANPNVPSKAQGGAFTGQYSSGTCVMYAFSSDHYQYCPTCIEFVKKALLFKSDMQGRGW